MFEDNITGAAQAATKNHQEYSEGDTATTRGGQTVFSGPVIGLTWS